MNLFKNACTFLFCFVLCIDALAGGTSGHSFYHQLKNHDLSDVLNPDSISNDINERFKRPEPLGFIGPSFQRFQIHFTSFKKSSSNPFEYVVAGKTKVNTIVSSFTGTVTILTATYDTTELMEDIGFPTYKGGTITSKVLLYENKNQSGAGFISGELVTQVYFDNNGKLTYLGLTLISDGFKNNLFTGSWTGYKTGKTKRCNWGDYRVPDSYDLDNGTDAFNVHEKYIRYGWESYVLAHSSEPDTPQSKKARQQESVVWWK